MFLRIKHELFDKISLRLNWIRVCRNIPSSTRVHWNAKLQGENIRIGGSSVIEDGALIKTGILPAEYVNMGEHCRLQHGAQIYSWGGFVSIGDHCSINSNTIIYGTGGVKIGYGVRIAANTVIVASMHKFDQLDTPIKSQGYTATGIEIEDDVWIGAGVTVLDGVGIGSGVVVAAGAVVNRDVPANSVVGGVPAKIIRKR